MNKKLYIITLLVGLMIIITLVSNIFISDIKKVAISNNDIDKFEEYILREGEYSFLLPEEWDIDKINNKESTLIAQFSNKESISGSVSVENNYTDNIYNEITGDIETNNLIQNPKGWKVLSEKDKGYIIKYYIKNYSEGKILIMKFSYKEGYEKNSIKTVFDYIANSFQ